MNLHSAAVPGEQTRAVLKARIERLASKTIPVGKALVTLDPALMALHGLNVGDVLKLQTPEGLVMLGRLVEPDPDDASLGLIRCDRYMRQSLRARLNTSVTIQSVHASPVRQLFLQPPLDLLGAHHLAEHLQEHLAEDRTPVAPGAIIYLPISHEGNGAGAIFNVARIDDGLGYVGNESRVFLIEPSEHDVDLQLDVSLDDVGGLDAELRAVLDLVQLPLQSPGVYRQLGIQAPRGIILYGPPGTGKTHMSRALAQELDVRFYYVNGPEIIGSLHGETEGNLRRLFGEAAHHAPSIICIDEIDALASSRRDLGSHADVRAVTQLLSLMDGLRKIDGVVVIGTTNQLGTLDPAFRRAGRFDREIYIGPPGLQARVDILRIQTREMPLAKSVPEYLATLAEKTHGFVGADLVELCREAGLASLRRVAPAQGSSRAHAVREVANARVSVEDLEHARSLMRPSAGRHSLVTTSAVTDDDVVGLESQRRQLFQSAAERFAEGRSDGVLRGGVIVSGPPGCGKTLLVHALAAKFKPTFIVIRGPEIFSKWLGDTEEAVRHTFELARRMQPSLVFFDQLEAVAPTRGSDAGSGTADRVVGQLLTELDELSPLDRVLVIGASNRVDLVDQSILRSGRIGFRIEVPLPDAGDRRLQLLRLDESLSLKLEHVDIAWIVERTENYSGSDLSALGSLLHNSRSRAGTPDTWDVRQAITDAMSSIKRE